MELYSILKLGVIPFVPGGRPIGIAYVAPPDDTPPDPLILPTGKDGSIVFVKVAFVYSAVL
jgi:hypothetical protein